jgi:hypothetical protein
VAYTILFGLLGLFGLFFILVLAPYVLAATAVLVIVLVLITLRRSRVRHYPRWGGDWQDPGSLVPSRPKPRKPTLVGKNEEKLPED